MELCPKLRTQKISPQHIDRRNVLSTQLEKGGRSERDKLGRHRSTESIIPPSSDARPLFIAQIVKRCLQHDFVARVNQRQLILGSGLVVQVISALRGSWQDFNLAYTTHCAVPRRQLSFLYSFFKHGNLLEQKKFTIYSAATCARCDGIISNHFTSSLLQKYVNRIISKIDQDWTELLSWVWRLSKRNTLLINDSLYLFHYFSQSTTVPCCELSIKTAAVFGLM